MTIKFAIRWEPKGTNAEISYMAINDETYEYLIQPIKITVNNDTYQTLQQEIIDFFKQYNGATLERKTVIRRDRRARNDSIEFHNMIDELHSKHKINIERRLRSKLKGTNLKNFKKHLQKYDLIRSERGFAWQHHLWSVALHATNGTTDNIIRKLDKKLGNN